MGQSLKGMCGIVLQKRKISQTFSIRFLAICTKIAHYADVVTSSHLLYNYFNLRCRIKASSLQDKTEGEYGILMNNYQQN